MGEEAFKVSGKEAAADTSSKATGGEVSAAVLVLDLQVIVKDTTIVVLGGEALNATSKEASAAPAAETKVVEEEMVTGKGSAVPVKEENVGKGWAVPVKGKKVTGTASPVAV
jgi:hypothetical protein